MGIKIMTSVLFTPAGSGNSVAGIKALTKHGIRTVGTDIRELSPGLHLADVGYIVPPFDEDQYMQSILNITKSEGIDIVIPALDPILTDFAEAENKFESLNASVMISPIETLRITLDKWRTYQYLSEKLPFPQSWIEVDKVREDGEYFIKPRHGHGSEDANLAKSQSELEFYYEQTPDPIIQTYLPGSEFTIDCLTDDDGSLIACVPRKRHEIKDGISTRVEVVHDERLFNIADRITDELRFTGPFFIQAKEDETGDVHIIEIGARTAGTMCPGFVRPNLHYLAVQQLTGGQLPDVDVNYGVSMSRYWSEMYFTNESGQLHRWQKNS